MDDLEGNNQLGIAIALFPHDAPDHKPDEEDENMKTARLIKRNLLSKPFDTDGQQQTEPKTTAMNVRKAALNWVRERQEHRQVNPRAQFIALFRNAV